MAYLRHTKIACEDMIFVAGCQRDLLTGC
jgi:hypothetical protein